MSTTLQELKNQIDAANELGVTNITKKGGTISSDATTAEIMAEIDNLPSGGGSAPTVVNEITWNGTGDAVETDMGTLYKISDNVLPYNVMIDAGEKAYSSKYSYDADVSDGTTNVPVNTIMLANNGFMVGINDNGGIICATATVIEFMGSTLTLPSSGTYGVKIDSRWLARITATPANG